MNQSVSKIAVVNNTAAVNNIGTASNCCYNNIVAISYVKVKYHCCK